MSTRELIEKEIAGLPEPLQRKVYEFALRLKSSRPQEHFNGPPKPKLSVLDMPPLNLGRVLRPLDRRDDLLEEMLDDTRF